MQRARRRNTGKTLLAYEFDDEQWKALGAYREDIVLACGCPLGALQRRGSTKYFAHQGKPKVKSKSFPTPTPPPCAWTDREKETLEHEAAKQVVERACREAGWTGLVEAPGPPNTAPGATGPRWWADVLASKEGVHVTPGSSPAYDSIAFEVQWSRQTLDKTKDRQRRYADDKVRGCWFFREPPRGSDVPNKDLPIFPLTLLNLDDKNFAVTIGGRQVQLGQGVVDVLTGKVRFRQEVATQWWEDARLTFAPARCPRCAEEPYVHAAAVTWHHPHNSPCRRLVYPSPEPESRTVTGIEVVERADVATLVERFFAHKGAGLRASPYKQWEVRSDLEPAASSPLQMAPVEPAEPMAQPEPEAGTGTGVEAQGMGFLGRARRRLARLFGREPSPPVASSSPSDVIPMPPASPPLSSPPAPSPPAPTFVIGFGCPACETPFDAGAVADALAAAARTGTAIIIEDALGTPQRKSVPLPHWCYPDGGRECCALAAAADGGES